MLMYVHYICIHVRTYTFTYQIPFSRIIVVPHITDAIGEWIQRTATTPVDESGKRPHVCVIEVGIYSDVCTYV